jgi:hypothetical protein
MSPDEAAHPMDQHAGASIALSFALVVAFAIALYQPDHPPATPGPTAVETVEAPEPRPAVASAGPPPPLTPGEPIAEAVAVEPPGDPAPVRSAGKPVDRPARPRTAAASGGPPLLTAERGGRLAAAVQPASRPRPTQQPPSPPPRRAPMVPSEPFTVSEPGETLREVAARIYGTPDRTDALWRLNRDLVARRAMELAPGTLLRTR